MSLSRNLYFYSKVKLKDSFETRVYLMFFHFSIIMLSFKAKNIKFSQTEYDDLFFCIENNLRELGFGDVSVNKKMKDLNKVLYDILLKILPDSKKIDINNELALKYFPELVENSNEKSKLFKEYFIKFYHFCFEKSPEFVIREIIKFKV